MIHHSCLLCTSKFSKINSFQQSEVIISPPQIPHGEDLQMVGRHNTQTNMEKQFIAVMEEYSEQQHISVPFFQKPRQL